jgi:putative methyltransferase (TIGR04325 family)
MPSSHPEPEKTRAGGQRHIRRIRSEPLIDVAAKRVLKEFARRVFPPAVWALARELAYRLHLAAPEWEYVPEGWSRPVRGWDTSGIAELEAARWLEQRRDAQDGYGPVGQGDPQSLSEPGDLWKHNFAVTNAYVFSLAADGRRSLSVLDWGGSLGQFHETARRVLPETELEYHVKEVAATCAVGRRVNPSVHFHADDACLERPHDLVFLSAAFQYAEDWRGHLAQLAAATGRFLYVTRLPIAFETPSFVVMQRGARHGYEADFLAWVLNRSELLRSATDSGLTLVHEFLVGEDLVREALVGERVQIRGAPEQFESRGFLFRPT